MHGTIRMAAWVTLICGGAIGGAARSATAQSPAAFVIRGGVVVDGTGAAARRADVRIRDGVIAEVGASLAPNAGERVIDASGLVVAPGFIDLHSHATRGLEDHPEAESQVRQGITTVIVGVDGGGELPISDFYDGIERIRPTINYAAQVGHGTVRSLVMGGDYRRQATPEEIETMKALVDRAMRDGALGLSSGLEYDPGFYAQPAELEALVSVVARYDGFYSSHVRDEENKVFDAWREVIDVGRKTGARVHISHIKLASAPVWGMAAEGLAILDQARADGVRVTADWYPYTYWQSSMYVLIPTRRFEDRQLWETGLAEIGGAQNVLVTGYDADASYNGRTIADIAHAEGTDPVSLIIQMVRKDGPGIGIIGTSMVEEDLATLVAHPAVCIGSDGGIVGVHPRYYGAFPRVLARYVRDLGLLTLPEAIAKMTGRSARIAGIGDRGVIAPGKSADIVVFDAERIQDRATKQDPQRLAVGVHYVLVNGELVLDEGELTGARPGRPIRRAGWHPYPATTTAGG